MKLPLKALVFVAATLFALPISAQTDVRSLLDLSSPALTDVVYLEVPGVGTIEGTDFGKITIGSFLGLGTDLDANGALSADSVGAAEVAVDAIGTAELDDDANSPTAGDLVIVESGAASFGYLTLNAGTSLSADLEEETHATEHAENAADELLVENLGTACTSAQGFISDGAGGVDCTNFASSDTVTFALINPTTSESGLIAHKFPVAATIIEVACFTNTGTATINLEERAETTPNTAGTDVMASDIVCDTDQQEETTFTSGNTSIDANDWLALTISAVASTPGTVVVTVRFAI